MNRVEILHVEDDPLCVELVQRALRKLPLAPDYLAVADGEQALAQLASRERLPQLLLLDLRLARGNGLQLLATLRDNERTRGVPVVVFTSSQERRDVMQSYQLGASSYVIKPLEYKEFYAAVAQIVSYWFTLNHQSD